MGIGFPNAATSRCTPPAKYEINPINLGLERNRLRCAVLRLVRFDLCICRIDRLADLRIEHGPPTRYNGSSVWHG